MGPGKTCWAPTGPVRSHAAGEEGQAELLGSSCSPEASVKAELNPDLQLFWLREDLGMELLSAGARQDCSELQQLLGLRLLPFLDSPTAAAARLFQPGPSCSTFGRVQEGLAEIVLYHAIHRCHQTLPTWLVAPAASPYCHQAWLTRGTWWPGLCPVVGSVNSLYLFSLV